MPLGKSEMRVNYIENQYESKLIHERSKERMAIKFYLSLWFSCYAPLQLSTKATDYLTYSYLLVSEKACLYMNNNNGM